MSENEVMLVEENLSKEEVALIQKYRNEKKKDKNIDISIKSDNVDISTSINMKYSISELIIKLLQK